MIASYKFTGFYKQIDSNKVITIPFIAFNTMDRIAQSFKKCPEGYQLIRVQQKNKNGTIILDKKY